MQDIDRVHTPVVTQQPVDAPEQMQDREAAHSHNNLVESLRATVGNAAVVAVVGGRMICEGARLIFEESFHGPSTWKYPPEAQEQMGVTIDPAVNEHGR